MRHNNPLTREEINRRNKEENRKFQQKLTDSIHTIESMCPNEWEFVLDYIQKQNNQKKVLDDTPDNIAARWAYAYSRIQRILLRLRLEITGD